MARVFISYRREDSEPYAMALREELQRQLGSEAVFLDSKSIDYGTDFLASIQAGINAADVCLVLIGRRWLTVTDGAERSRLMREGDWVRQEVRNALAARDARGLRVIPVLLQDTRMPSASELPEDLQAPILFG